MDNTVESDGSLWLHLTSVSIRGPYHYGALANACGTKCRPLSEGVTDEFMDTHMSVAPVVFYGERDD